MTTEDLFRKAKIIFTVGQQLHHDVIKDNAQKLFDLMERGLPSSAVGGRELALAKTNLEQAVMWYIKGFVLACEAQEQAEKSIKEFHEKTEANMAAQAKDCESGC